MAIRRLGLGLGFILGATGLIVVGTQAMTIAFRIAPIALIVPLIIRRFCSRLLLVIFYSVICRVYRFDCYSFDCRLRRHHRSSRKHCSEAASSMTLSKSLNRPVRAANQSGPGDTGRSQRQLRVGELLRQVIAQVLAGRHL